MVTHYSPPLEHDKPHMKAMQSFELSNFTYGDLLTNEWLSQAFCIEYQGNKDMQNKKLQLQWFSALDKFTQMLAEEHNMHLANAHKQGYIIVKPQEQTKWAESEFKSKFNKLCRKAARRLTLLDTKQLTQEQIKENDAAISRLAFMRQVGSKKKLSKLLEIE